MLTTIVLFGALLAGVYISLYSILIDKSVQTRGKVVLSLCGVLIIVSQVLSWQESQTSNARLENMSNLLVIIAKQTAPTSPKPLVSTKTLASRNTKTGDLCKDFSNNTFFAPNPYKGQDGWFYIPTMGPGTAWLRIYNLAGDNIYKATLGELPADGLKQMWPRVNMQNQPVAPGVYFAVVRFEATSGTKDVCQTVKKIIVE